MTLQSWLRPGRRPYASTCALGLIFVSTALAGCGFNLGGGPQVQGSGVVKTEKRDVAAFSAIEVSGAVKLEFTVGDETKVEVTTDDNLLPLFITEVDGETLKIYTKGSTSTNKGMVAKVSGPSPKAITGSGAITAEAKGLKGKALKVQLSGASNATLSGTV